MVRRFAPALVLSLLLLFPVPPAAGIERFRGPVAEVPPDHPLAPSSPAPARPPPATPEHVASFRARRDLGLDHWLFWWYRNRDGILAERAPPPPLRSGPEELVDRVIVPVLEKALANEELHPHVRACALVARARAGRGSAARPAVLAALGAPEIVVRHHAIFALAVLGDRDEPVLDRLRAIATDPARAAKERGAALLALGLLRDDSEATWACVRRCLDPAEVHEEVGLCALLAVGLAGDPRRVPDLLDALASGRFGRRKLRVEERAYVVDALGRIGDPRARPAVTEKLAAGTRVAIRRAAAIAAGRLVPRTGEAAADWLSRLPAPEAVDDLPTRELLLISLGRMAPSLPESARAGLRERLLGVLDSDADATVRGYAALALGLGFPGDVATADRLVACLDGPRDRSSAAALALGLALDRRETTAKRLLRILADRGEAPLLREMAATALGFVRAPGAAKAVARALADPEDRMLRLPLAMAAGLAPLPSFPDSLLALYADRSSSLHVLGAAADAVGRSRDFRLLTPLVTILEPSTVGGACPDAVRAFAAVALGLLGSRRDGDVLAPLTTDLDWLPDNAPLEAFIDLR